VEFRRRSPQQHAALLRHLATADFTTIRDIQDPQQAWDCFYQMARGHLELFYPLRSITMTTADPHFLTLTVKHLLRKKNRLMRAGRTEEASAYARRVGRCIELATRAHLRDIDPRHGLEDMWRRVGELTNRQRTQDADIGISAAELNDHSPKSPLTTNIYHH